MRIASSGMPVLAGVFCLCDRSFASVIGLFSRLCFDTFAYISLAITQLHNASTSDDDLSPSQYGLLAACLCKRAESALKMARAKAAQEDCHYALTLAGCFTEDAPKASAVSAKVKKTLSRCFEIASDALKKDRALGRRQGAGEAVSQTLLSQQRQQRQQTLQKQQQASKEAKNSADWAGHGQDMRKVCIACGAADRNCFSNRQWAGKAHSRRCLACSALPAGGGVDGEGESAHVIGGRQGAAGGDSTSTSASPLREQESEPVKGPIVRKAVLAAKVLDSSAYAHLPVYVEEECFVCMDAWDSPGLGGRCTVSNVSQYPSIHAYIHTCMHTYIRVYMHTCMHAYIHTYIHNYIHTYIHIYIHIYIHTYIHTLDV